LVAQLRARYHPEKVIVFGSLARGAGNPDSDIDLLVVKADVPHLGVERVRELERLLDRRAAADLIVLTPSEVERGLARHDPFLQQIVEEGQVLFSAG
jgi:predicted nucleotidyltransferase